MSNNYEKFLPIRARWMNTEVILHQTISGNIISFIPNFEAFVMMARSITLILQKHLAHVEGFEKWYDEKQRMMKNDEIFKFFGDLRVEVSHLQTIEHPTKFTLKNKEKWPKEPIIFLIQIPNQKTKIEKIEMNNYNTTKSILEQYETKSERYVIAEYQNADLIYLGCAYLNKLKEMLDECVRMFTDRENIDHLRTKN
ncbi:MAG: hypothetical protein ACW9W4_01195 [Candidatus Nitrosopumilus sp. bin_7KS]